MNDQKNDLLTLSHDRPTWLKLSLVNPGCFIISQRPTLGYSNYIKHEDSCYVNVQFTSLFWQNRKCVAFPVHRYILMIFINRFMNGTDHTGAEQEQNVLKDNHLLLLSYDPWKYPRTPLAKPAHIMTEIFHHLYKGLLKKLCIQQISSFHRLFIHL